jgi:transposase
MIKKSYSEKFKQSSVEKLLAPGSPGLSATARKIGVGPTTLFGWKKKYASHSIMKKSKEKIIRNWSFEEKFQALLETTNLNENDLGEYIRRNGLYSSDLESFKKDILDFAPTKGRNKLAPEVNDLRKQKKNLEKDLARTKNALAEQSARIILLKKSHEIWGDPEDDE